MIQRRLTCLAALLLLAACEGGNVYASGPDLVGALPDIPATGSGNGTASGTEGTFDHPAALGDVTTDVREALARIEEEGPPGYTARVHACRKLPYATLGRVLASRGVNLDGEGAGALYR
jgi:hypothetical protein